MHFIIIIIIIIIIISGITTLYESEPSQLWGYEVTHKDTPHL
jgi:hypothetical protein